MKTFPFKSELFSIIASAAGLLILCSSSCVTTPPLKSKPGFDFDSLRDVTHLPQGDDTYILKDGTLELAGKSRVTLMLESFCLDVDKPAPGKDEIYYFVPSPPRAIPLYKEILSHIAKHPEENKQSFVQNILWNIRNDVKFEDLSGAEREFLLRVDMLAPLKINSRLKESLWKRFLNFIGGFVPSGSRDISTLIKGKPLAYSEYAEYIGNLPSTKASPASAAMPVPMSIGTTGLYGIAYTRGYSRIKVVIYNPSNPKRLILKFIDWVARGYNAAMGEATKILKKFAKQDIGMAGNIAGGGDEH